MTAIAAWATVGFGTGAMLSPATWLIMFRKVQGFRIVGATGATTAVTFGLIASSRVDPATVLTASLVAAIGIQLAVIDMTEQRLPRELIWPTLVATIGVLTLSAVAADEPGRLTTALAAMCVSVGFYCGLSLASQGGIGAGDVRLTALLGCVLGWQGWTAVFTGTLLGFVGTTLAAAALTKFGHHRRASLPHGPSMVAGMVVAILM